MADPLQVLSSLETPADHYAVFEPDQVLTHGQLNSVSDFWGDQVRLSRVALSAVGLVAGLHVARGSEGVRITRGFGVSTDGDLMVLAADTLYDRFRPYDTTAPVYRPFYRGSGADGLPNDMMALHELVPAGESDVLARPLSALPATFADAAVLMLMETVVNDPDVCTGTDCDNLGRDALHRRRLLLVGRADAQALLERRPLRPASEAAQALPTLAMRRPALGRDITATAPLADRFRASARASLDELRAALPTLAAHCPEVLTEVFGSDPTARWQAALATVAAQFTDGGTGLQQYHAFVKDLVDQWNALREALLADDAVRLPALEAFPKHLLLGTLTVPRTLRTGLYPSPLDATARERSAHARFLAWKLDAMIAGFALPTDTALRVTPSFSDAAPLEQRAIPWYYRAGGTGTPIHAAWNFHRSSRRQEGHNLGYRAAGWASTPQARDPLAFAIGQHDFFRIEGHLGRQAETVAAELRRLATERNLPFQVQAVLVHTSRERLRVRPPFRYTPLHSLHRLVRQDVALRLEESEQFGQTHLSDVSNAVNANRIPAAVGNTPVIGIAQRASAATAQASRVAAPLLAPTTYSGYRAAMAGAAGTAFKTGYAASLASVREARTGLGELSRADFVSPFDGLLNSNQPHWLDWLDELIADHDRQADERLLLSRFVQDHPGLDHLGGTWRGGTFVLVYDDQGRVVADFALPYPAAEDDSPEPEDPPLTRPPYRPPLVADTGIRPVRPFELVVQDRFVLEREDFRKDLAQQRAYIDGKVEGVFTQRPDVKTRNDALVNTADSYLNLQAREMVQRREHVRELQELLVQPGLPEDTRTQLTRDLDRAQLDLADSVGGVATRLVAAGIDVDSPAGQQLAQTMTQSLGAVQSGAARTRLGTRLDGVSGASQGQTVLLANLRRIGGL